MKTMKRGWVVASSVICLVTATHLAAQTAAPAAAPVAAPVSTVSAEQKAAVAALLDAMNFKQQMAQMSKMMVQSMPQMLDQLTTKMSSSLSPEQQANAREVAKKSMTTSMDKVGDIYSDPAVVSGMEDIMARAYGKLFTVAEIKSMTAFYKSDAGKKMLNSMPQLMQQTMPEIMGLIAPRMQAMTEKIAKDAVQTASNSSTSSKQAPSPSK